MSKRPKPCPNDPKGAVWCEDQNCDKCGLNPEVAEARLEAVKQKLAEEEAAKNGKGNTGKSHN